MPRQEGTTTIGVRLSPGLWRLFCKRKITGPSRKAWLLEKARQGKVPSENSVKPDTRTSKPVCSFDVDKSSAEGIRELAADSGISVSEMIRRWMVLEIRRKANPRSIAEEPQPEAPLPGMVAADGIEVQTVREEKQTKLDQVSLDAQNRHAGFAVSCEAPLSHASRRKASIVPSLLEEELGFPKELADWVDAQLASNPVPSLSLD